MAIVVLHKRKLAQGQQQGRCKAQWIDPGFQDQRCEIRRKRDKTETSGEDRWQDRGRDADLRGARAHANFLEIGSAATAALSRLFSRHEQPDDLRHYFDLMPDPNMTTLLIADELCPLDLAGRVFRTCVSAEAVVTHADDERWRTH